MADWKRHMNSGFSNCRLLAYARDNCRNRDVKIFQIPHVWDAVGVSDGVDSWIAPTIADPFSVNIKRMMQDLLEGKQIPTPTPPGPARRRAIILDDPKQPDLPAIPAKPAVVRKRINF